VRGTAMVPRTSRVISLGVATWATISPRLVRRGPSERPSTDRAHTRKGRAAVVSATLDALLSWQGEAGAHGGLPLRSLVSELQAGAGGHHRRSP
jgi:hypothetical protein